MVVTAVTVAVAVTPASMEQETGARRSRVTIKGLQFMPADVVVAPAVLGPSTATPLSPLLPPGTGRIAVQPT